VNRDVSVVVCAYDEARWRRLEAALASLARQTRRPTEVLVVVDGNPQLLRRAREQLEGISVLDNAHARGLAGARTTGVENAAGEVVAFLDDDAFADEDWLVQLLEPYADSTVAGVGGRIEPVWPTSRPAWFPEEFDWVVGCSYLGLPTAPHEVRNLIGCNMSFRRSLLDELGPFKLGYGCDETELCIRLRQRWPELRLLHLPQARVFHHVAEARARFSYFVSRCYLEGGAKAAVSSLVGASDGLASERRYTRDVLPRGLRGYLAHSVARRDPDGLRRAAAIVAGVTAAAAGYGIARVGTGP
jgi:glycosyltransferase involved in cell wall biosynthesis